MARKFVSASAQRLIGNAPITAVPFTFKARINPDNITAQEAIISLGDVGVSSARLPLFIKENIVGDPVRMQARNGATNVTPTTSSAYSADVWQEVAGKSSSVQVETFI